MSELWTYKGARKKYPVMPGDTWVVGEHRLICGDLEGATTLHHELADHPADLMYVDPPWNNQIATAFRTKSGADGIGNPGREVDAANIILEVLRIAKNGKMLCFMEGGHKMREMNRAAIHFRSPGLVEEWTISYTDQARPCALWALDFRDEPRKDWPNFAGMSEFDVETLVMSHYRPKRVVDPCGGLGGTAWAAARTGCASITHELSPYKTAEAIKLLVKVTGHPARKV